MQPAQQTVRDQIAKKYSTWSGVFEQLRHLVRSGQIQYISLVSMNDLKKGRRPEYKSVQAADLIRYQAIAENGLTSAKGFRIWVDDAPFETSSEDQSAPKCATVVYLKRGEDISAYLNILEG